MATVQRILSHIRRMILNLKGSKTKENLEIAFANEAQASQRYHFFAVKAEVEGRNAASDVFRAVADNERGHAQGHLDFLVNAGERPATMSGGTAKENLAAALAYEMDESSHVYPAMAREAREEGFTDIANWLEAIAKAEYANVRRLQQAFDALNDADNAGE